MIRPSSYRARWRTRDVPDAEIHILDAGHFALDEQADKVAQLTRDFLARRIGPSH